MLGALYRRSLLDYDAALERYNLHDLVRVFARARLDTEVSEPLALRHVQHYIQVAAFAQQRYLQGGESILAGLGLFDRERVHIDAGWAFLLGQLVGPAIDDLLIAYAHATVYIGDLRYDKRRERIPQLVAALAAAGHGGHRAAQGRFLNNLGLAYTDLGEVRQAIELYEQRLAMAREVGDRRGEGIALNNLGSAYRNLGEVRRAIEYYEQVLVIMREVGDRHGEGNALANLGNAYRNLGDVPRAIEYYEQRLGIAHKVGDQRGEAFTSWNLGEVLAKQGDLARAIALMQVCVDYERAIGHADAETDAAQVEALRQQLEATADAASPEGDAPAAEPPA